MRKRLALAVVLAAGTATVALTQQPRRAPAAQAATIVVYKSPT